MNYGDYAYIEYFPRGMFLTKRGSNLGRQQEIFQVWIRPVRNNNDAHFATRVAMYELDKLINAGITETDFEATRAYLYKFVSLLTDGQSRRLGYALDSQYYGIEDFSEYVRDGLEKLTLDDVNRTIRENLQTDDVQFVFITGDASDLRARLVNNQPSPIQYGAEKAADLLEEDRKIADLALRFHPDSVNIVSVADVFE